MLGARSAADTRVAIRLALPCRAVLEKQQSKSLCNETVSFGCINETQIWIDRGCRGHFRLLPSNVQLACGWPGVGPAVSICAPLKLSHEEEEVPLQLPSSTHELRVDSSSKCMARSGQPRLAFQMSGCLRELNHSMAIKLAGVADARGAGYAVDLFCALEACSEYEVKLADGGLVTRFVEQFRATAGSCSFIHCAWWKSSDGILLPAERRISFTGGRGESSRLKPDFVNAQPGYPYPHNMCNHGSWCSIDFTLVRVCSPPHARSVYIL